MKRYNNLEEKNKREIILLKGLPCFWKKCSFCDYFSDGTYDLEEILNTNKPIIDMVQGYHGRLEVINSGSFFELPEFIWDLIREKIKEKNIKELIVETHFAYRHRLDEVRNYFSIPIVFKLGVESFNSKFRNEFLNKNAHFNSYKDIIDDFKSICLLFGIKGQSRDIIREDIKQSKHFDYVTINIFTENTTNLKRDEELIQWFLEEYHYLFANPKYEILTENTDFGVGD